MKSSLFPKTDVYYCVRSFATDVTKPLVESDWSLHEKIPLYLFKSYKAAIQLADQRAEFIHHTDCNNTWETYREIVAYPLILAVRLVPGAIKQDIKSEVKPLAYGLVIDREGNMIVTKKETNTLHEIVSDDIACVLNVSYKSGRDSAINKIELMQQRERIELKPRLSF
ncbi:MAG: hypothetical protein EPO11_10260 [Gammaproteobacteria bacterium]|nr:MAG: hypothetical protein EPO11_10260 [Gammaproteobacteria bacterium]